MMGRQVAKVSNQSGGLSVWIGLHEGKEVRHKWLEMNGMVLAVVREWVDLWMISSFCFFQVSSQFGGDTSHGLGKTSSSEKEVKHIDQTFSLFLKLYWGKVVWLQLLEDLQVCLLAVLHWLEGELVVLQCLFHKKAEYGVG